jgi:putative membrane protein
MNVSNNRPFLLFYAAAVLLALVVSGIHPHDRLTWFLEVAPILAGLPLLAATHGRFPLTTLAYTLVFFHALILIAGGHSTYALNPLGEWAKEAWGLARNPYDRLGHFAQGFVPAILAREILLRTTKLERGKMLFFLVLSVCLFISAFYEFIEWWSALLLGQSAEAFLGTQGDVWDTQWDLFLAFVGAIAAQLTLTRLHDAQLARVPPPASRRR